MAVGHILVIVDNFHYVILVEDTIRGSNSHQKRHSLKRNIDIIDMNEDVTEM